MEAFPFQYNHKNLDLSYRMDLARSLRLFRNGKTHIIAKFHWTDLVICSHSRERKTPSYSQRNTVFLQENIQQHLILTTKNQIK